MRGLIVKEPYATLLVSGKKKYEYRTRHLRILEEPVYIIAKGHAVGIVTFDLSQKTSASYPYTYRWRVKACTRLKPRKINMPQGAQIWIKNIAFADL